MQLLPCAWKQLLGISCPFCGFQRAVLLLCKYNRQNERCTFCKTKGAQKIQLHSNRGGHQIGVRLCYLYVPFEYVFSSSNTIQTLIEQFIYTLHIEYKLDVFFALQEAERVEEVAFIDVHIA